MYGKLQELLLVLESLGNFIILVEKCLIDCLIFILDRVDGVVKRIHVPCVPCHIGRKDESDNSLPEACKLLTMKILDEV